MSNKFWCSVKPFDFIKGNKIKELADEVKYISSRSTMQEQTLGIKINNSKVKKILQTDWPRESWGHNPKENDIFVAKNQLGTSFSF